MKMRKTFMDRLCAWLEKSMEVLPGIGIIMGILFLIQFIIRI